MAARRRIQPVIAPVLYHHHRLACLGRQPVAPMVAVLGTCPRPHAHVIGLDLGMDLDGHPRFLMPRVAAPFPVLARAVVGLIALPVVTPIVRAIRAVVAGVTL